MKRLVLLITQHLHSLSFSSSPAYCLFKNKLFLRDTRTQPLKKIISVYARLRNTSVTTAIKQSLSIPGALFPSNIESCQEGSNPSCYKRAAITSFNLERGEGHVL